MPSTAGRGRSPRIEAQGETSAVCPKILRAGLWSLSYLRYRRGVSTGSQPAVSYTPL